jgi:parallel beta-helix repeat protein
MKNLISFLALFVSSITLATNYYVSQLIGSETNDGLLVTTPFLRIEQAENVSQPGDIILVMNGIYTKNDPQSDVVGIYNSGTASNWITYKNFPGHNPIIQMNANNWVGIRIQGADYIIIDGFTVIGNNDNVTLAYAQSEQNNTNNPTTSGNGISISYDYNNQTNRPHHSIIRNCIVSKCGGGGIGTGQADYITIENNTVFDCAWYTPYDGSAISLYQNWNSDLTTGIKNYVIGNVCYNNYNLIPFFATGTITDGNGIIIDDSRNTQFGSTAGIYVGTTYIANNVVFNNGARGIHCYSSDNVIIANNTSFKNCQSPTTQEGEFTAFDAGNITFVNNISFPDANIPPIGSNNVTNLIVDYNLWATNSGLANPIGTNFVTNSPDFILPNTNPINSNFRLLSTSGAINTGTLSFSPPTDKDGNPRNGAVDIGAFEFQNPLSTNNNLQKTFLVYPNPATDMLTINLNSQKSELISFTITNTLGQKVKSANTFANQGTFCVSVSDLTTGIYFIILDKNEKGFRFIKK